MSEKHKRSHIYHAPNIGAWLADHITGFAGSWAFVGLHIVWFALWFVFRLDINTLTLIVSLEAIFLTTFVMMSQNRSSARDELRDNHEAAEVDEMAANHKLLVTINEEQLEILRQHPEILSRLEAIESRQTDILKRLEAQQKAAPTKK